MVKSAVPIVILFILGTLYATPLTGLAEDYPVSVIETDSTPGFAAPKLYLNAINATYRLLPTLVHNRTLHEPLLINTNKDLGEIGAPINWQFMVALIYRQVKAFNQFVQSQNVATFLQTGVPWQLKIFHPGIKPGALPARKAAYHLIVFCSGASGSDPALSNALDWLGTYYARRGYVVAIPVFIGNDTAFASRPFYEIATDIYALQASLTINYIGRIFNKPFNRNVATEHVTLIGHSLGGFVAQKTAIQDPRIARLCLLSSVFVYPPNWPGFLIDTVDMYDLLNQQPKKRGMALHVQRFTRPPYPIPCPDFDPECDWIPPVDGFITQVDLSSDPWEPHTCDGEPCGIRDGTLYNYALYEGPKQTGIKNNILLDHGGIVASGVENDAGKEEVLRYLDEFFTEFPVTEQKSEFSDERPKACRNN